MLCMCYYETILCIRFCECLSYLNAISSSMRLISLFTKKIFFHIKNGPPKHKTSSKTIPDIIKTRKLTIANPILYIFPYFPFLWKLPLKILIKTLKLLIIKLLLQNFCTKSNNFKFILKNPIPYHKVF